MSDSRKTRSATAMQNGSFGLELAYVASFCGLAAMVYQHHHGIPLTGSWVGPNLLLTLFVITALGLRYLALARRGLEWSLHETGRNPDLIRAEAERYEMVSAGRDIDGMAVALYTVIAMMAGLGILALFLGLPYFLLWRRSGEIAARLRRTADEIESRSGGPDPVALS